MSESTVPEETEAEDEIEIVKASVQREFPCQSCGAELMYRPGSTVVSCPYCAHENAIPQSENDIVEHDYAAWLQKIANTKPREVGKLYQCGSCDAILEDLEDETAFDCPYCSAPIVLEEMSESAIKPESLLPFKVSNRKAQESFRRWLGSLWFAPTKLSRFARDSKTLKGIYLPYWTYDSNTTTFYRGQRGDAYWDTVTTFVNGKHQTRRVRKIRWSAVSGTVWVAFDDVLIPGAKSLPREDLDELEPWDLGNLVAYDPGYLAGFRAERYQVDLEPGFDSARAIMDESIKRAIHRDIGGDQQRISSHKTEHNDITFKHLLLPLWVSAYRFKGKVFRFLVNARTGEVRGERPYSWAKIIGVIVAVLLAILAIAYFAGAFATNEARGVYTDVHHQFTPADFENIDWNSRRGR